ncbi:SAM-dependent methyltransferase [Lysinibacillus sp. PLM2]|nr:SAM-dependent methyltransferase [Lysinibacillus sp. PLM2]
MQELKDNWDPKLYDQSHSFVSKLGGELIDLLMPAKGEKILDLGCGTGDLTNSLNELGVNVIGVDKSKNMIEHATAKYPNILFEEQDATNLKYMNEFDAVFSNATLHWVKPPLDALHCIYQSLKVGGRFVAEFGGKGNVQTIINEIINQIKDEGVGISNENNPWFYPSIGEYTSMMENVGFHVVFAQHFERPTILEGEDGMENWITMFGSQLLNRIDESKKKTIIKKVENRLKNKLYQGDTWIADYKRIRVMGIKESL